MLLLEKFEEPPDKAPLSTAHSSQSFVQYRVQQRRSKMAKKPVPATVNGHPFHVGKHYRNRDGEYQVINISEPNMTIRFLDGRTVESAIVLQARIWENIQEGDDADFELEDA
jgi:hypothetical protein